MTPDLGTHREHLSIALWYLRDHPREEATGRIREGIRHLNLSRGNTTGYHGTITLAWVAVIARFVAEHDHGQPLSTLVGELLEECSDKGDLLRFYSEVVLMSDESRRSWVPPGLRPIEPDSRCGWGRERAGVFGETPTRSTIRSARAGSWARSWRPSAWTR
jgi:hypothetical protein